MKTKYTSLFITAILTASILPVSATFPIATNTGDTSISFASDGTNYLVGIQGDYVTNNSYEITAQLISSTGTLIGSRINPVPGHTGGNPAIACSGTNYLMVWPDDYLGGDESSVSAQLIGPSGGLVGGMIAVTANSEQKRPVAAYGGGKYLVLWEDYSSGTAAIYGQLVSPSGALAGAQMVIYSDINNSQRTPAAAFGQTNFCVVWEKRRNSNPEQWDTYGIFISPAGVTGAPFAISQTVSARYNPPGVVFNGTNYLVVWNRDTSPGGTNTAVWNICGRFVTPSGTFPGNEVNIVTNGNPVYPLPAFDGGNYLLTWNQGAGTTNSSAYFQFLDATGRPIGSQFTPFSALGSEVPLFAPLLFDGKQFVAICTLSAGGFAPTPTNNACVYGAFIPASTALPQFGGGASYGNKQFSLSLTGTPGINYAIQMTTNLASPNWISLTTNSSTNGTFSFADTSATNASRFYRAVKQ